MGLQEVASSSRLKRDSMVKTAVAKFEDAKISTRNSILICRELQGKKLSSAKTLLQDLIDKKRSIGKRYYTSAAEKILEIVENVENNAKEKNLDIDKTFIKIAKADQGTRFLRPRSRFRIRGRTAKQTHITIEVEER